MGSVDISWRQLPALAVPAFLSVVAMLLGALVDHLGVHLCGWPATVSCDFGVPVVWQGLAGALWTVAAVAAGDAVRHVIAPDPAGARRMVAWTAWGAVVLLATAVLVIDRTLQALDLALGALVMLCALVLIARTVGDRLRLSRAVLAGVFAGPMIAVLLIPAWAPAAFRAAERADPARQDEDRRQRSQECHEDLAAGRAPDGPSATVLQACDVYPAPIGR